MPKKFNLKKWWVKRKERGYTLLAVPNSGGRPARLHIPVSLLLVILAFGVLLTGVNVYMWCAFPAQINRIGKLYREIARRDEVIVRLDRENKEIQPRIERSKKQADELVEIQRLATEARLLMESVRKKGGRGTTPPSRGIIIRNRLPEMVRNDVVSGDGENSRLATIDRNLAVVGKEMDSRKSELHSVIAGLRSTESFLDHLPTCWPISTRITSFFGIRHDPFTGMSKSHQGLDMKASVGAPVHATAAGRVISAGWSSGYGLKVEIDHGNGYHSIYGHNSRLAVHAGQYVSKGQIVSYAGSTGRSTAPHLHFQLEYFGRPVNPLSVLNR